MTDRVPRVNEVDWLGSVDGKTVFSIRIRFDRLFEFYIERKLFDEDEGAFYWSQDMLPRPHIFGSIEDARAEILAQFRNLIGPDHSM
ncbi:MAG: hypothetical protein AAGH41_06795 [Pseudomonadota bacterium]